MYTHMSHNTAGVFFESESLHGLCIGSEYKITLKGELCGNLVLMVLETVFEVKSVEVRS